MCFNSTLYLVYLLVVVTLYYHLSVRQRQLLLLLASYVFYWVWSVPYSLLLVYSTFLDYSASLLIASSHSKSRRRAGLFVSLVGNLGVLALFKYADFFSTSTFALTGFRPWPVLDLLLPLGISFYTFQTMSYTIDVYRGVTPACRSFVDFALFVSFFPQLVAGPIVRSGELIPQLSIEHKLQWVNIRLGIGRIIWGLVKKVYFADAMAQFANEAYGSPSDHSGLSLMLATYAFAVQIYCDFSGYSDIAIGSARLLGMNLPENFRSPYLSLSIREFWRRWHISLSTWLRDYLYIPLGGNRHGVTRTYVNLMLTMLLGGLWHGAGWNWIVWGGLQGVMMCVERLMGMKEEHPKAFVRRALRWIITFHLVCLSWVFFRAQGMEQALLVLRRIGSLADGPLFVGWRPLCYLAILLVFECTNLRKSWLAHFETRPHLVRWAAYGAFALFCLTFAGAQNPEFIYFQF